MGVRGGDREKLRSISVSKPRPEPSTGQLAAKVDALAAIAGMERRQQRYMSGGHGQNLRKDALHVEQRADRPVAGVCSDADDSSGEPEAMHLELARHRGHVEVDEGQCQLEPEAGGCSRITMHKVR